MDGLLRRGHPVAGNHFFSKTGPLKKQAMKNCCGQKRDQWNKTTAQQAQVPIINSTVQLPTVVPQPVNLKYTGLSYLILKGNRSGRQYYFTVAQPVLEIENGDAGSMMAHPMIIRV